MIDLTLPYNIVRSTKDSDEHTRELFFKGHYGTHLDIHLKSEVPLSYIHTSGVIFDVNKVGRGEVGLSDFEYDKIKEGDFVIFRTGMMEKEGYGTPGYMRNHTTLAYLVIELLIQKKVKFIGIDAVGIRRGAEHIQADKVCEESGVYIIENLYNLDLLVSKKLQRHKITTMWWPLPGQTGLPCRVIAE